jgi:hypothetical protein
MFRIPCDDDDDDDGGGGSHWFTVTSPLYEA